MILKQISLLVFSSSIFLLLQVDSLNQELEGKRAKEVSSGPGGARRPGGGQGGLVTSVTGRLESINI